MNKLILASASPRRKEILEKMGLLFEVVPSCYEEILDTPEFSYEKIEMLAYYKAKDVAESLTLCPENEGALILSADTVVVFDNQILGKPKDEQDAISMLRRLSGNRHFVVTSACVLDVKTLDKEILSTTSYVEFQNLSDSLIENYVKTFNPLDKAGAYGIQELPEGFLSKIEGSFENVIGLCPLAVSQLLSVSL